MQMTDQEFKQKLNKYYALIDSVFDEIAKRISGQRETIEHLVIALLSQGHCLLVGVPGLEKTLIARTLSDVMDLQFSRIQFTPDLMPSDVTGVEIIQEDAAKHIRDKIFMPGPVFTNILLADEINRTPPRTQSALLQAMQELEVTIGNKTYPISNPFFVIATQNPIEQEGTYPLPEAQLDRFLFSVNVEYPDFKSEIEILHRPYDPLQIPLETIVSHEEVIELRTLVENIPVSEDIYEKTTRLVRATRPTDKLAVSETKEWIRWGASPRATVALIRGARAYAVLRKRLYVKWSDVENLAGSVLRHRLVLNFKARTESINIDDIITMIVDSFKEK